MTERTENILTIKDANGTELSICWPEGPHSGIDASITIEDLSNFGKFYLDDESCREIRGLMERLLNWSNEHRLKPS